MFSMEAVTEKLVLILYDARASITAHAGEYGVPLSSAA